MASHLIIPDPHAHPDHPNDRFEWLGELVADLKPTHVICIGDWACMPSLSSYDKGTRGFEGRRYRHDINVVHDAQYRFFDRIKRRKKKQPTFWMLEGNHEYRIERAINADAVLHGTIGFEDLEYENFGWNVVRYNGASPGVLELDGIAYAHFFTSGVMGRPIGGIHPAYQLIHKQYQSTTQGHIHTTDYCVRTNALGRHIQAMVVGCYIDYWCGWAGEANKLWWKGVVFKEDVNNGNYDPAWISLDAIRRDYA